MRKLAMTVCAVAGLSLATVAHAETYSFTLAGASPGGLWSNIGVGMDQVMKAAYPGSTVTYQTTGGGLANIRLLDEKKVQLGVVHNVELQMAIDGKPPFKKQIKDLRPLAYLYNWSPFQLLLTKDFAASHDIKTFEDLITKKAPVRVTLNRRGNIANELAVRMIEVAGGSLNDIKKWGGSVVLAGSEEQSDLMKDRRVDLLFNSLFVGQRSLIEVGELGAGRHVARLQRGDRQGRQGDRRRSLRDQGQVLSLAASTRADHFARRLCRGERGNVRRGGQGHHQGAHRKDRRHACGPSLHEGADAAAPAESGQEIHVPSRRHSRL